MYEANACSYCAIRFEEGEKRKKIGELSYHKQCAKKRQAEIDNPMEGDELQIAHKPKH